MITHNRCEALSEETHQRCQCHETELFTVKKVFGDKSVSVRMYLCGTHQVTMKEKTRYIVEKVIPRSMFP